MYRRSATTEIIGEVLLQLKRYVDPLSAGYLLGVAFACRVVQGTGVHVGVSFLCASGHLH
jgi:hypothetical protein